MALWRKDRLVTQDPFKKFNIKWLSASSLNAFRSSQSVWCLQYLLGAKGGMSIPMVKGIAGEDGWTR
jgi:hypothetical protein